MTVSRRTDDPIPAVRLRGDAETVLAALAAGGVAIVPLDVAYAVIGTSAAAIRSIFAAKERAGFNYGGITILVNNMPRDNTESCGRIRDNLAILAEGADARRQAIEVEEANRRTQEGIRNALGRLHSTLDATRIGHQHEHQHITQLMVDVEEAMAKSFVRLGLTVGQENAQIELMKYYIDRIADSVRQGYEVTGQLEHLATELKELAVQ